MLLFLLFFSYCLSLRAQTNKEENIITTLDSLELPIGSNKTISWLQFAGDTAVYYLLKNNATLYVYSLTQKTLVDSLFLSIPIPELPPSNNFYYTDVCDLLKKEIPIYFKITPDWIYIENNLGYALRSRNGTLLESGHFCAPRKGKTWYTAEPQASFYSDLLGCYVYKPTVRARPRYEKRNSDNIPPFNFEKEYYSNSNYTLARYCLEPSASDKRRFQKRKARLFHRSPFDFSKHSYAYYLYHTHLAVDQAGSRLYIGFASDPQITVTDSVGKTLLTFGQKGKHINENVAPSAVPAHLVGQIEKRPFKRKARENQSLIQPLNELERFSARYHTLFWDACQRLLFRWYEFSSVSPYFQPPFTEGQYTKSYGLQVYDEYGKLLADKAVHLPFKFYCANSDGTFWAATRGSYKEAGGYTLYRFRLALH